MRTFEFRDGKIYQHTDRFGFWRWSRQALGAAGVAAWAGARCCATRSVKRHGAAWTPSWRASADAPSKSTILSPHPVKNVLPERSPNWFAEKLYLCTVSLDEKIAAVEGVFEKAHQEMRFSGIGRDYIVPGDAAVRYKADIEATPLEFLPFAYHLYQQNLASRLV